MFVFDLFEKKKQDAAAGRFVGGTSQDARVKNALDNAYRAVPAAKSPEEAALGYIDIQNSLNQKQDQALDQQTKTNQQQTQQINDLVADMRRKENDFRNLNAQIANMPNVTPQQAAKMAQDIEAAHDANKDQPADVSNVIAKQTTAQPAKKVAAPSPGASISQLANYQQAKDQGATTAKTQPAAPQATPAPAVTPPGRVIKGKNQSNALGQMAQQLTTQPVQQELPVNNVTPMPSTPAIQQRLAQLKTTAGYPTMDAANAGAYKQFGESTSPADLQAIAQHNNQAFSQAWAHSQSTKLYFGDGQWEDLTFQQVEQIVSAIATDYTEQTRPQVWQQLFTDHNYFTAFKAQHLSQMPLQFSEGDVVPMTDNQTTNQAYADALTFLKLVYANPNNPMITTMRQDFAHKYQQRFQISQHPDPDRSYYLLDKQLSKKYNLPTPDFRGLEEEPYDGKSDWSDGKGQWSSENNLISSGNNPMGFSESADDIKKRMSKLEALALAANRAGDDDKCKMYQQKVQSLKQKLSQIMTEELGDSPVASAITRHILKQRLDLLKQYGPELVGAAVDNVADYVGDGDGSSDVSAWVTQVERMLKDNPPEAFSEAGSPAQQAAIAIAMKKAGKKPKSVDEAGDRVDPILIKALNRMPDGLNSHGQVLNAAYDAYAMELGRMKMKSDYGVTNAYIPQLMDLYKEKYGLDIKEEQGVAENDDGDWVDDPKAHAQVNRAGFNKLTPQIYNDKIDFIDRQLRNSSQEQNWPEFKKRRLELMTAAQRAGIIKEQDRVTEIKKGQKDSNGVTKCWPGYEASGTKKGKNGPVRNCVKKEGVNEAQQLSVQQLAQISDAALDSAYGYGRSSPGNTFGWQANLKSAAFAKQMIDRGVTDIEAISDAIHKGWNVTAQAFVKNPDQFDDSKTMAPEKLQAKIAQRQKLMTQQYAQLPEDEKEKDRVVARAMLQAITGEQGVAEEFKGNIKDTELKNVDPADHSQGEGKFVKNQLHTMKRVITHLDNAIGNEENLPAWVQSELAQAVDKIVGVMDYSISSKEQDIEKHQGGSALMKEGANLGNLTPDEIKGIGMMIKDGHDIPTIIRIFDNKPTAEQITAIATANMQQGVAEAEGEYKVYYMTAEDHKLMGRYASREEAEQRLNQLQSEYPDNKFIIWKNSKQGMTEMDKSQPSQERHGHRPLGAKGTTATPVAARKVVKDLAMDLDQAFAKQRPVKKKGVAEGTINYWTKLQNERNTKIASLVSELTESVKDIK